VCGWPGNIRQLLNICEGIVALGGDSLRIDAASFDYVLSLERDLKNGKMLGWARSTLWRKMKQYDIILQNHTERRINRNCCADYF
jgi:transcriptional regulator of acetoin/glycerol metabolism